jgi:hypothetical protein
MDLELDSPVRGPANGTALPLPGYSVTQVVILQNLAEVFDKGTIGP